MFKVPALKPWSVSSPVPAASFTTLLFVVVIVGCVYVGREVLVPMALAILLSFALAPPVELLQRWYVPRSVAVIGVVLLAFVGVFSLGGLMIRRSISWPVICQAINRRCARRFRACAASPPVAALWNARRRCCKT